MLETISLQVEGGAVVVAAIVAVIVAVIVSIVFLVIQRRTSPRIDPKVQYDVSRMQTDLQKIYTDLTDLKTGLPHTNEVNLVQENVKKLCGDFTELKTTIEDQMNKFRLGTTEDLTKTRDEMIKTATEKLTDYANDHLTENSITREEFEHLKSHIEKVLGADEVAERMEVLSAIFDSTQIKTLNWQCRLIKLLNGGLAPDAEEDLIVSQGIPRSSCEKFLKKLTECGISMRKQISAFYLTPDYEWIYSYVEKPDWLQNRLEKTVKKENEYQQYIKSNLNLVEEGLLLEESEYELATGRIDFICRDPNGKTVGLELKYPAAITTVKRQIAGYRKDYEEKTGRTDSRFILVAPQIPEKLKLLLVNDGFEYKEIDFKNIGKKPNTWNPKEKIELKPKSQGSTSEKKTNYQKIEAQKKYPNAYERWIESDDEFLKNFWSDKSNKQSDDEKIKELMQKFGRNEGAILSRLNKMGFDLGEKYGYRFRI